MWPLRSRITSSAFGMPAAIASGASGVQVRSWRPASTSTGWVTSPSRSSRPMCPYPPVAPPRRVRGAGGPVPAGRPRADDVGREHHLAEAGADLLDARVTRVGEVERELVGEQAATVLLRARLRLARPRARHLVAELLRL